LITADFLSADIFHSQINISKYIFSFICECDDK